MDGIAAATNALSASVNLTTIASNESPRRPSVLQQLYPLPFSFSAFGSDSMDKNLPQTMSGGESTEGNHELKAAANRKLQRFKFNINYDYPEAEDTIPSSSTADSSAILQANSNSNSKLFRRRLLDVGEPAGSLFVPQAPSRQKKTKEGTERESLYKFEQANQSTHPRIQALKETWNEKLDSATRVSEIIDINSSAQDRTYFMAFDSENDEEPVITSYVQVQQVKALSIRSIHSRSESTLNFLSKHRQHMRPSYEIESPNDDRDISFFLENISATPKIKSRGGFSTGSDEDNNAVNNTLEQEFAKKSWNVAVVDPPPALPRKRKSMIDKLFGGRNLNGEQQTLPPAPPQPPTQKNETEEKIAAKKGKNRMAVIYSRQSVRNTILINSHNNNETAATQTSDNYTAAFVAPANIPPKKPKRHSFPGFSNSAYQSESVVPQQRKRPKSMLLFVSQSPQSLPELSRLESRKFDSPIEVSKPGDTDYPFAQQQTQQRNKKNNRVAVIYSRRSNPNDIVLRRPSMRHSFNSLMDRKYSVKSNAAASSSSTSSAGHVVGRRSSIMISITRKTDAVAAAAAADSLDFRRGSNGAYFESSLAAISPLEQQQPQLEVEEEENHQELEMQLQQRRLWFTFPRRAAVTRLIGNRRRHRENDQQPAKDSTNVSKRQTDAASFSDSWKSKSLDRRGTQRNGGGGSSNTFFFLSLRRNGGISSRVATTAAAIVVADVPVATFGSTQPMSTPVENFIIDNTNNGDPIITKRRDSGDTFDGKTFVDQRDQMNNFLDRGDEITAFLDSSNDNRGIEDEDDEFSEIANVGEPLSNRESVAVVATVEETVDRNNGGSDFVGGLEWKENEKDEKKDVIRETVEVDEEIDFLMKTGQQISDISFDDANTADLVVEIRQDFLNSKKELPVFNDVEIEQLLKDPVFLANTSAKSTIIHTPNNTFVGNVAQFEAAIESTTAEIFTFSRKAKYPVLHQSSPLVLEMLTYLDLEQEEDDDFDNNLIQNDHIDDENAISSSSSSSQETDISGSEYIFTTSQKMTRSRSESLHMTRSWSSSSGRAAPTPSVFETSATRFPTDYFQQRHRMPSTSSAQYRSIYMHSFHKLSDSKRQLEQRILISRLMFKILELHVELFGGLAFAGDNADNDSATNDEEEIAGRLGEESNEVEADAVRYGLGLQHQPSVLNQVQKPQQTRRNGLPLADLPETMKDEFEGIVSSLSLRARSGNLRRGVKSGGDYYENAESGDGKKDKKKKKRMSWPSWNNESFL
ncbi:hypothetical protein HK100_012488 [Physocladia obscura]|uniref:Uncharacterized protein n=1 Tax=Physocladia obscura TaxID=109957 RepID=A0AAD5T918_9FUNG|nr:hypothetical protein HK100_012488 [Physocladia obscura]